MTIHDAASSGDMRRILEEKIQSAEYVKHAKIFDNYFWLIFRATENLGDPFLLILCLLKIFPHHSC